MHSPLGIIRLESTGDSPIQAEVCFPQGCCWFDGHFPGYPVLPGVALLAVVRAVLARRVEAVMPPRRVVGFGRVRFRKLVRPDQPLDLRMRPGRRARTQQFQFTSGDAQICEGLALWEEALDLGVDQGPWSWR